MASDSKKKNNNPVFIMTVLLMIAAFAIMMCILAVMRNNLNRSQRIDQMENERVYCEAAISSFSNTSDMMTEDVWEYAIDGDWSHVEDYWHEVNVNQTRDKEVQKLLHSDLTEQEKDYILRAKSYSDNLIIGETWSMRLLAEINGISVSEMPQQLQDYKISDSDENMTSQEKRNKVKDYLLGPEYAKSKQDIRTMVENFRSDISIRMEEKASAALTANKKADNMATVLVTILMLVLIGAILFYTRQVSAKSKALVRALIDANSASEAKSYFTSRMSHEIRTPLNAVIGYLTLAKEADSLSDKNESIDNSRLAAQNLLNIVNDVLDLSAIENQKVKLAYQDYSISSMLADLNIVYDSMLTSGGLTMDVKAVDIEHDVLVGDQMRMNQILTNLVTNSIKFTPEGGSISVCAIQSKDPDDRPHIVHMRYMVSDTGIGMKSDFLPHIFEAYEQENGTMKHKYGGTGLGLYIVKTFTEMMGGTISVESAENKGTCFTLDFDCSFSDKTDVNDFKPAAGSNDYSNTKPLTGMHILLAEDNKMNSDIASRLITAAGADVTTADNGLAALEAFENSPNGNFDVILMDIQMPVMDGYEATAAIRSSSHADASEVPILAMTANAFASDVDNAIAAGMNGHIAKPFDVSTLMTTLAGFKSNEQKPL